MHVQDPPSWPLGLAFSLLFMVIALLWNAPFPRWLCGLSSGVILLLIIFDWALRRDARKVLSVSRDA